MKLERCQVCGCEMVMTKERMDKGLWHDCKAVCSGYKCCCEGPSKNTVEEAEKSWNVIATATRICLENL